MCTTFNPGDIIGSAIGRRVTQTPDRLPFIIIIINIKGRALRIGFFRSNRISNRIGRPIRFRIESSNRIGPIHHASRNSFYYTRSMVTSWSRTVKAYNMLTTSIVNVCVVFVVLKATGNLAWMMEWTKNELRMRRQHSANDMAKLTANEQNVLTVN